MYKELIEHIQNMKNKGTMGYDSTEQIYHIAGWDAAIEAVADWLIESQAEFEKTMRAELTKIINDACQRAEKEMEDVIKKGYAKDYSEADYADTFSISEKVMLKETLSAVTSHLKNSEISKLF